VVMPDDIAEGLRALGWQVTGKQLLEAGERIVNLERMFNVRNGFSRKDDQLPERFTSEPLPVYTYTLNEQTQQTERSAQPVHTGVIHDFQAMLDRYYVLRGWDSNGVPTPATLQRLDLKDSPLPSEERGLSPGPFPPILGERGAD
jgi:aldehyde:ferredoxin oxidoreductase